MALCLRDDADAQRRNHAWVTDTYTGTLLYDGATDLTWKRDVGGPYVKQVGQYLVATVDDVGVYGVGQPRRARATSMSSAMKPSMNPRSMSRLIGSAWPSNS